MQPDSVQDFPIPAREEERLAALRSLCLLDTPPEERFDRIARLARRLLDVPTVLVTFVDRDRQWFKSRIGVDHEETPREVSFCAHAILDEQTLVVPDARLDPRFADNPQVTGDPHIRFYAGHPITGPDGNLLGTLCVIDSEPRELSDEERGVLADLARMVETEIRFGEIDKVRVELEAETSRLRRMEENRREAQVSELRRHRFTIDRSPDAMLWLSPGGSLLDFNETLGSRLGYSRSELRELTIFDLHSLLTAELWTRTLERLETSGSLVFEWEFATRSGVAIPVEISMELVERETGRYVFAIARDVSELRHERRLMRHFVEDSPAAVALFDREMHHLMVSRRWREEYELGDADLIGRSLYDVFPDLPEELKVIHHRALSGETVRRDEDRYERSDGREMWVEWEIKPWRTRDGEIGGVIVYSDVITERKKREMELEESRRQLLQAQKMEAVGRLAGGIAHDFNNLLSVILGFSELIRAKASKAGLPGDEVKDLKEVITAAERAADLTRQLLAFSRQQVLSPRPFFLDEALREMTRMLGRLLRETIELEVDLEDGLPAVYMDPGQLSQVVMNLAVNASDAMPEGGRLLLKTRREGDRALLIVQDTGEGIEPAGLEKIFEPFYTTKEVGKGTGLGLSTVLGIVEQSGGSIRVESERGVGTTFFVELPTAERPREETAKEEPLELRPMSEATVLLVEDDDALRALTSRCLREAGFRVLDAENGSAALELLEREDAGIDLLFTDLVMPGLDGVTLSRRVRAVRPDLPVLFMTGYSDDLPAVEEEIADGRAQLLHKPLRLKTIVGAARAALLEPVPA